MTNNPTWADAVTAIATAVAVIISVVAFVTARRSAGSAERSAAASERSADSAHESAVTARSALNLERRSQIDASAAIVTMTPGPTQGPYLLRTRDKMPYRNEHRMWDPVNIQSSQLRSDIPQPISLDEDSHGLLYFVNRSYLDNEGAATAWVRVAGESRIIPSSGADPIDAADPFPRWELKPGDRIVVESYLGKSLGQWVAAHNDPQNVDMRTVYGEIIILDPRDRFVDHIFYCGDGQPLERAAGPAQWTLTEHFGVSVIETRRTYTSLGEKIAEPPWVGRSGL